MIVTEKLAIEVEAGRVGGDQLGPSRRRCRRRCATGWRRRQSRRRRSSTPSDGMPHTLVLCNPSNVTGEPSVPEYGPPATAVGGTLFLAVEDQRHRLVGSSEATTRGQALGVVNDERSPPKRLTSGNERRRDALPRSEWPPSQAAEVPGEAFTDVGEGVLEGVACGQRAHERDRVAHGAHGEAVTKVESGFVPTAGPPSTSALRTVVRRPRRSR